MLTLGILLFLALVYGVTAHVVPLVRLHTALGDPAAYRSAERLGSRERLLGQIGVYLRLPDRLASRKALAVECLHQLALELEPEYRPRAIRLMLRALASSDGRAQMQALRFLEVILRSSFDMPPELRTECLDALAALAAGGDGEVPYAALRLLRWAGEAGRVVTVLGRWLESPDVKVRTSAVEEFERTTVECGGTADGLVRLASRAVGDPDGRVRDEAVLWLHRSSGRAPDSVALPALGENALGPDPRRRRLATDLLERMKAPAARSALATACQQHLGSEDPGLRRSAVMRLERLCRQAPEFRATAVAGLRGLLGDNSPTVRRAAARVLAGLDPKGFPPSPGTAASLPGILSAEAAAALARRASVDFMACPSDDCIKYLRGLGAPLLLDPGVEGDPRLKDRAITIRMTDVEMGRVLEWTLRLAGLEYRLERDGLHVIRVAGPRLKAPFFTEERPPLLGPTSADGAAVLAEDLEFQPEADQDRWLTPSELAGALAEQVDVPIIVDIDPDLVDGKSGGLRRLTWRELTLRQALDRCTQAMGLAWHVEHGAVVIGRAR